MVTISPNEIEQVKSKLRRYYTQEQQLIILRSEVEALDESLRQLKAKLETMRRAVLDLGDPQRAIDYSQPMGTEPGYAQSQQDRGAEQYGSTIETLEAAVARREQKLTRLELRIRAIEEERAPITRALELLDDRSRFLVDRRYGARWSFSAIGVELNLSSSAAHKMHIEILERLAELLSQTEAPAHSETREEVRRLSGPET